MDGNTRLLLVARKDALADGLLGFFSTVPGVQVAGRVDHVSSSLTTISDQAPCVLVLSVGPSIEQEFAKVMMLRTALSGVRCIVLADDVQQQCAAEALGADAVLLKGCRPAELGAAVSALATAGKG